MSTAAAGGDVEAGFAKLQGEDFEYYMQTYSIVLGRNSKKSTVDVDLSSLGGGMNISRHHARIFYDFARRRFALEVLGKNGCLVEGVLHLPGNPPVKLDSQDLLQIGDKEFYFLLPVRSILVGPVGPRHYPNHAAPGPVVPHYNNYHLGPGPVKKAPRREYYEEEFDDEDDVGGRKMRRDGYDGYGYAGGKSSLSAPMDKKSEGRSRVDRDADNLQLQQLEEKDVVSSVATVLSDLCGPGEWMPMEKLHTEDSQQGILIRLELRSGEELDDSCTSSNEASEGVIAPCHTSKGRPGQMALFAFKIAEHYGWSGHITPHCVALRRSWLRLHRAGFGFPGLGKLLHCSCPCFFKSQLLSKNKLFSESAYNLLEQYSSVWHHNRVRRYLTSEDWPGPESKGKPWYGLLMLLRKYPEHFVINTRSKGRVTLEFVSLVSLIS
ncbi:hypothetical protein JHK87_023355 [Glycine soja]|nr:hypothetical protein JHK87_023355 [Glycine soja]